MTSECQDEREAAEKTWWPMSDTGVDFGGSARELRDCVQGGRGGRGVRRVIIMWGKFDVAGAGRSSQVPPRFGACKLIYSGYMPMR